MAHTCNTAWAFVGIPHQYSLGSYKHTNKGLEAKLLVQVLEPVRVLVLARVSALVLVRVSAQVQELDKQRC